MDRFARAALVLIVAFGCERGRAAPPPPDPAIAVVARPSPLRLRAGESRQLSAQANDAAGAPIGGAPLEFASKTPALVKVTAAGLVTSVGPSGTGQVEISSGGATVNVDIQVGAGTAHALRATAGDRQTGAAGSVLAESMTVRAEDLRGNPVPGVLVRFRDEAGGAAMPLEVTTDAEGLASTRWTLSSAAGSHTLIASVDAVPDVFVSLTATALAGPASRIEGFGELAESVPAGETLAARIRVVDANSNPVEGVPITWSDEDGGAFENAAAATDHEGSAGAQWRPRPVVGERRAFAVTPALPEQRVELVALVRSGAAARVEVVAGDGQRGVARQPARVAAVVRVEDAHGNPVSNAPVEFSVASGAGSVDPAPVVTDEAGLATARAWVLGAGANTLKATVVGSDAATTIAATGRGRR